MESPSGTPDGGQCGLARRPRGQASAARCLEGWRAVAPRCHYYDGAMSTEAPRRACDLGWSWLERRGDFRFAPPVPASKLPAAVTRSGNPVEGMTRGEKAVLSVLRLWPRGATAAAMAQALDVHRTTVHRGLSRAHQNGYVVRSDEYPPYCRWHRRSVFWRLADADHTAGLMPFLPMPERVMARGFSDCGLPARFWHIFWSGADPSCLRLPRDATLVGCRLMESFESEARSWVLSRFTRKQLEDCLSMYPNPDSEVPTLIRRALVVAQ